MAGARAGLGAALLLCVAVGSAADPARSVLFVGNSFTYADESPVQWYEPNTIRDLNGEHRGGVPALFHAFAEQVGARYEVSLEAIGGAQLSDHIIEQLPLLDARWDVVVLQDYSTLDPDDPGNPDEHVKASAELVRVFRSKNPDVEIHVVAVWPRADQIYRRGGHWYGKPIDQVASDLRAAGELARKHSPVIASVIPVGEAWTRAMRVGVADANPYDRSDGRTIDLWASDHYHGSNYGYYLSALTIFGALTQCDPRVLGEAERAARSLGVEPRLASRLQSVAHEELVQQKVHMRPCSTLPDIRYSETEAERQVAPVH